MPAFAIMALAGAPPDKKNLYELDLREQWLEFYSAASSRPPAAGTTINEAFLAHLREIVTEPEYIGPEFIGFCHSCGFPEWDEDMVLARGNSEYRLCDECRQDWTTCDQCDAYYPGGELTTALSDNEYCSSCINSYYSYCEACEGWYPDEDEELHDHMAYTGEGCCARPFAR